MKFRRYLKSTPIYYTLIRYFLSYFLILSFFMGSFLLLMRNQLTSLYFNELNKQAEQRLENVSQQFSNGLASVGQVDAALTSNITLIMSRYINTPWNQYQCSNILDDYTVGNNLIKWIVYYDRKNDMILSSEKYVTREGSSFRIYDGSGSVLFTPPHNLMGNASEVSFFSCPMKSFPI